MIIFIIICLTSLNLSWTNPSNGVGPPSNVYRSFPQQCLLKCGGSGRYSGQIGMVTQYSRCIPWGRSNYSHEIHNGLENTTFCVYGKGPPWCGTNSYVNKFQNTHWDYCKKEECKFISTSGDCPGPMELSTTTSTIQMNTRLCYTDNCLVVAYSRTNECFLSTRCTFNCTKIEDYKRSFFSFCHVEPHIDKETTKVIISSLAPNTSYGLYVLPITDSGDLGNVTRLNVTTRPSTMPIPSRIDLVNFTSTSMRLKWKSPSDLGVPSGIYRFQLELFNGTYNYMNDDDLQNLDPCRVYCFRIRAFHYTEPYYTSGDTCFTTAQGIPPAVGDISITENTVEWSFPKGFTCPFIFEGQYHQLSVEYRMATFKTGEKKVDLSDLVPRTEYRLQVRACVSDQAKCSRPGPYSHWVSFSSSSLNEGRGLGYLSCIPPIICLLIAAVLIYIQRRPICDRVHLLYRLARRKRRASRINIERPVELKMEKPMSCRASRDSISIDDDGLMIQAHKTSQSIEEFTKNYSSRSEDDHEMIKLEYKKVREKALQYRELHNLLMNEGQREENASKNKYRNILPYDHNRVALKGRPSSDNYINASYISRPDDPTMIEYIASQGPVASTVGDFWRMIWDEDVNCIVMLTECYEDGQFKCEQYWPNADQTSSVFGKDSEFTVILLVENHLEDYVQRSLQVYNQVADETRVIAQLHMASWNDFSAPDLKAFAGFLFAFHERSSHTSKCPYLVHCSAGVGRTGTFVAIDRIVRKLAAGHREVDIFGEVLGIRIQRDKMVQRQAQYVFIYEFINYFLGKYTSISPAVEETHIYSND